MKIKNQLLLTVLLLSYLTFSSCGDRKSNSNEEKNPFGIASSSETQILQPCHWLFTVEQSASDEVILVSTAKLDSGWHLYSQHLSGKGPSTEFTYDSLDAYKLLGDTEEGKPKKEYNPYLEMEVLYFEEEAVFKQKIKVLNKMGFTINGAVDYMVCLTQSQCVHFDEEFSFKVKGNPQEIN